MFSPGQKNIAFYVSIGYEKNNVLYDS